MVIEMKIGNYSGDMMGLLRRYCDRFQEAPQVMGGAEVYIFTEKEGQNEVDLAASRQLQGATDVVFLTATGDNKNYVSKVFRTFVDTLNIDATELPPDAEQAMQQFMEK